MVSRIVMFNNKMASVLYVIVNEQKMIATDQEMSYLDTVCRSYEGMKFYWKNVSKPHFIKC